MNHDERRAKGRTLNTEPTMTDQSQASETDLNVIMRKYGVSGRVPATTAQPMYGDFTNLPTDLRDMIETSRTIKEKRSQLPKELREMPIEELLALTPEELTTILTPPQTAATPPDPT